MLGKTNVRKRAQVPRPVPRCGFRYEGKCVRYILQKEEVGKGIRWMPRLLQAMKDVISCEKPR